MEIENCAQNAKAALEICLERFPNSARANLIAAYFYLSTNTGLASKAETCLMRLRELYGVGKHKEVERCLVLANLAQEKNNEAKLQADFYLGVFGYDEWVAAAKAGLDAGTVTIVRKPENHG